MQKNVPQIVPQKSTTEKVQKRVHKKVPKIVHGLLKVPKKGPKKVLFLKIVPKIALLRALFGDQNLYDNKSYTFPILQNGPQLLACVKDGDHHNLIRVMVYGEPLVMVWGVLECAA